MGLGAAPSRTVLGALGAPSRSSWEQEGHVPRLSPESWDGRAACQGSERLEPTFISQREKLNWERGGGLPNPRSHSRLIKFMENKAMKAISEVRETFPPLKKKAIYR